MSLNNSYVKIARFLEQGRSLVRARIIRLAGSAPRSVGADCLVLDDGTLVGTIGGGSLEHAVIQKAKGMLTHKKNEVLHYTMMGENVAKSEMLCGGIVDILLEPLNPADKELVSIFSATKNLILNGAPGIFVSEVPSGEEGSAHCDRLLVGENGVIHGNIPSFSYPLSDLAGLSAPEVIRCPGTGTLYFAEPLQSTPEVLIFGAGHISTCIAPLAKMVGFRVVVIDDRDEFANRGRFPMADDIFVMPFQQTAGKVSTTPHSYIVIVTRGHSFDKVVLESMLDKPHAYLGMIGSKKKRTAIYQALTEAGVSQETLSRVYSPIGLDIGAETPEEIAVSIVAELIDIRASRKSGPALPAPQPITSGEPS
jgi:xanthine dehydrogenase accessory factor